MLQLAPLDAREHGVRRRHWPVRMSNGDKHELEADVTCVTSASVSKYARVALRAHLDATPERL